MSTRSYSYDATLIRQSCIDALIRRIRSGLQYRPTVEEWIEATPETLPELVFLAFHAAVILER